MTLAASRLKQEKSNDSKKRVYTRLMGSAFTLLRLSERVGDSLRLAIESRVI
jgi:hypothetical protein